MPVIPKTPDSCRDLDLVHVSRMLAKHCGYFPAAARELGVSRTDLRRLTWAKPRLLEEAHEEMELVVLRARSELITAMYSGNSRRRMWAADWILSSWMARDNPLAPARRSGTRAKARAAIVTRFQGEGDDDCLGGEAASLEPAPQPQPQPQPKPKLPVWPGPGLPPPLVAHLYAPPPPMIHREPPPPPRPAVLRRRLRGV
jgi:hypothetical protein